MNKIKTFNYLKHYREKAGFCLKDMARTLGMTPPTLSRVESGIIPPSIETVIGYHLILDISLQRLFKEHVYILIDTCLKNAETLQDNLLDEKSTTSIHKRLSMLEIIISRLQELQSEYE